MSRPCRKRRIKSFPDNWIFSATSSEVSSEIVFMSMDEYESIRLIDHEGLTQEECAKSMDVSRTTVTAIYDSARKKLAQLIIEGKTLCISGGAYRISSNNSSTIDIKGDNTMRIAVTYENGMIGQHFGHTEEFKLYDVEDGKIINEQIISSNGQGHGMLAGVLAEVQADVLICGGIGMGARMALDEAGIVLLPGVEGPADLIVESYINGTLEFDPDAHCDHHGHGEDHDCHHHENGCGGHHCHE